MSYAVRFLFGNVPRMLLGVIFVAVVALCHNLDGSSEHRGHRECA